MSYPYVIIDDSPESVLRTKSLASGFPALTHVGTASGYDEAVDLILEHLPKLVFLEIQPENSDSKLSLHLINELYRYLSVIPKIIITTETKDLAYEAIKYEVADYLIKPLQAGDFRKAMLKISKTDNTLLAAPPQIISVVAATEMDVPLPAAVIPQEAVLSKVETEAPEPAKSPDPEMVEEDSDTDDDAENDIVAQSLEIINGHVQKDEELSSGTAVMEAPAAAAVPIVQVQKEKPLIICVKSYGDYRFINASDICYLEADNNSTDIHISNGEIITAFKTLKHFETVLQMPFVRIHNSYIVNVDYVSRIHTGNSVCYIKDTTIKLPFSKSYKENIDTILLSITEGNYLET